MAPGLSEIVAQIGFGVTVAALVGYGTIEFIMWAWKKVTGK